LSFSRVQGTPDLLPSDVLGASLLEGDHFRFVPGPVFTNVLLVDEINRATPRTQSALLEAMEEGQVSIEGETRPLPDPFLVLATQNPIELEGTFALPEAQLDRFLVRLTLGYPSAADEGNIASRYRASADPLNAVEPIVNGSALLAMRETVRTIAVADEVQEYVVRLVRTTRERKEVRIGGSPRASVALYRAAQAYAYLDGRGFVLPDDVKSVAAAVLNHRVILDLDYSLRGSNASDIVGKVIETVAAPPLPE
jgi:MoxR-like ATPase